MNQKNNLFSYLILLVFLVSGVGGCKSLSEKFVRKPKTKRITVVAPEDELRVDPRLAYERHFVFAKVWLDEFRSSVGSKSQKRQRESLEQAIRNIRILAEYYPSEYDEKKELLYKYIRELKQIYKELCDLERKRLPLTRLEAKIEQVRRDFHINFLPSRQPEDIWSKLNIE